MSENHINQAALPGDCRPIGIFDSGVGGLSIAKAIARRLPNESFIYVADTLHSPYGNKSVAFIQQRVEDISQVLLSQSIKALVIACNTATVNAIDKLRIQIDIPVIGVEPAIKPAVKQSITKNIGILVTQATAENIRFKKLISQHSNGADVHIQACPGLVENIEAGLIESNDCLQLLKQFIAPLLKKNVDTLVLGCTHYPFLKAKIAELTKNQVKIIDTSAPVTTQLIKKLDELTLSALLPKTTSHQFYSTKNSPQQQSLFNSLWQENVILQSF